MRKIITILLLSFSTIAFAQQKQPTFKAEGDLVKATYYHDNGAVKTEGFFKDNKLNGEWVSFDKKGNKIRVAYYNKGKKVGKWLLYTSPSTVKEIIYDNNSLVSVREINTEFSVAINND